MPIFLTWGRGDCPTYSFTDPYDTIFSTFVDWGVNDIVNWDGQDYQWHTLEYMDWHYLLYSRNTDSGVRFVPATVNGVHGLILLPDNCDAFVSALDGFNYNGSTYETNILTLSQWEKMEKNGAVFLPASGVRTGTTVERVQESGLYWIAGPSQPVWGYVFYVQFYGGVPSLLNYCSRYSGLSVRLVRDAE